MDDASRPAEPQQLNSLLINVSTLLQESIGALRLYELAEAEFRYGDGVCLVAGPLRLLRTDQSVMASAQLNTSAEEVCGVCLGPATVELELEFDEEFWPGERPGHRSLGRAAAGARRFRRDRRADRLERSRATIC